MELKQNQIVKLRKGDVGVVMSFKNKPSLLVFNSFVSPLSRYNENLKHKNPNYDIVGVYEGKVEAYTDVYRKRFDISSLKEVYVES
jgi:hypothetical protein